MKEKRGYNRKKLTEFVENTGAYKVTEYVLIKDDKEMLKENITRLCNSNKIDLILQMEVLVFQKEI